MFSESILYAKYCDLGIIKTGHFLLTSGRHSNQYVDKDAIFRLSAFSLTISGLANNCCNFPIDSNTVITGPAVAGSILAAPVWCYLQKCFSPLSFVYPEKIGMEMTFRRGHDQHLKGKRVIIIEDIITTGGSVQATADAIKKCGGVVIGCSCVWNRTNWINSNFPVHALITQKINSWESSCCPLCEKGVPLIDPKN